MLSLRHFITFLCVNTHNFDQRHHVVVPPSKRYSDSTTFLTETSVQIVVAYKVHISSVNFFLQNYPARLPSFFMEMAIMYFTWLYFYETKSAWNEAVCLFSDLQNNNGKVIMCFYSKEVQLSAKLFFNVKCNVFPTLWYGMRLDENEK